jgi:hypothetical protein
LLEIIPIAQGLYEPAFGQPLPSVRRENDAPPAF